MNAVMDFYGAAGGKFVFELMQLYQENILSAFSYISDWFPCILRVPLLGYIATVCWIRIRSDPEIFAGSGSGIRISDPEWNY